MEEPEIVDIAPEGDVVFICAADDGHSVRIRVLSMFVSTASPVLKAMLGPKFKEGTTLAATSSVEVPLPDDDPYAMVLIFKAMHLRISALPSSLDVPRVKQLASAVDKYDCATPLAPMTHYWVQRRLQDTSCDLTELYELLHVTYLLDQQELFGQVGARLVLEATSPVRGEQTCLTSSYDVLELQRLGLAMSIVAFVQGCLTKAFTRFGTYDSPACQARYKYAFNFLQILQKWKLWELDPNKIQIDAVLKAMRKIGFRQIENNCPTHPPFPAGCNPSVSPESIAADFEEYADKLAKDLRPLCLKCLKAGDFLGNCTHQDNLRAFGT